jgi:hypothetical protein
LAVWAFGRVGREWLEAQASIAAGPGQVDTL